MIQTGEFDMFTTPVKVSKSILDNNVLANYILDFCKDNEGRLNTQNPKGRLVSNEGGFQSKDIDFDIKSMINKFKDRRKKETKNILKLTESIVTIFSNDFVGVNKFRGIALSFLDLIPPIKKRFVKKMSYGK